MNTYLPINLLKLLVTFILVSVVFFGFSANATEKHQATTTRYIDIEMEELELALIPLFKDEVKVELDAWLILLKKQATVLSEAEILVSQKRDSIEIIKEIAELSAESAEHSKKLDKNKKNITKTEEEIAEAKQTAKESLVELKSVAKQLENPEARDTVDSLSEGTDDLTLLSEKAENYGELLEKKRNKLIHNITSIREDKNDLLERFYLVLHHWESKGGEAKELRLYADSMSTTNVDLTDSDAAWLTIKGWLKSKDGGLLWLANIIKFTTALLFVSCLSFIAGKAVDAALARNRNISQLLKEFLKISVRRIILAVGFIVSLTLLEINVGPVLALIGAAGLVVGLALQSTLSNFASGMLILIYRPFDIGDVIEINGDSGFVHSMNLLSTSIKTFDNQHLIIPNNSVWGNTINNVTGSKTRRVDLVFGIGYGDDMDKAQTIIERVVNENNMVLPKPDALIKVHELADSSVNFICRPWVKTEDYWDVYWDITRQVKEQFDREGVSIPFPQRDVHIHQVSN